MSPACSACTSEYHSPSGTQGTDSANLPDRIYIYRGPLTRYCHTREQLLHQIRVTVLHEIGHHFGISDERLHELGWG